MAETMLTGQAQSPTQNICHKLIIIHEMCVLHLYQATSNMDANRNIWFVLGLAFFRLWLDHLSDKKQINVFESL